MKVLIGIILMMFLAVGCQTESGSGSDLVAGHNPVTNRFTVTNPINKTYKAGTTLDFFLAFPYPVTVNTAGGTPRLTLTIGAATVYADYLLGTGTEELVFRYTVQPGDTDTNGIAVASTISLNGGALTFVGTAGLDDCNLAITVPSTANVRVDTTAPTITSVSAPSNRTYYRNQTMSFVLNGSEALYASGSPRIPFTVGATTRYATYASGSGSTALTFNYTVQDGDLDADGIVLISPVEVNGGLLRDVAYNNLALTYTPVATPNVLVDGNTPYVTSVTSPANATYTFGQSFSFTLNFSEAVTVTGTPNITLTVGATAQSMTYASGSGTSALVFTYVVQGNDVDTNGVQLDTNIDTSGASILDADSTAALETFIAPSTPNVRISAAAPYISSFSITPASKTYITGETISITAIFNTAVTVNTAGGTPRIPVVIGSTTRYFDYISGSGTANLLFRTTVVSGDLDTDGISIQSPLDLNGGTIKGMTSLIDMATGFSPPSTPNVRVDAVVPTITSVTNPTNGNYVTGTTTFNFTVNFSETVYVTSGSLVNLNVNIGGTTRSAVYQSGSGTSSIVFRYVPVVADADADGVEVSSPLTVSGAGRIADQSAASAGNTANYSFTPTASPSVTVNYGMPVVQSITPPANGWHKLGADVEFTLVFSEPVTVAGTGPATFNITVGSTTRAVSYVSGSGTSNLLFRYTVVAADLDTNGIVADTTLALNGATIKSVSTNTDASLSLPSQILSSVNVDGGAPTILSVNGPSPATYIGGNALNFTVNMSETCYVTGNPAIALNIGGNTVYATYTSGAPGTALVFSYTVQNGDVDLDGIGNSQPVLLDGGEYITDAALNDANLSFSAPNTSTVLVQGTTPTIDSVVAPADGNYVAAAAWHFDLTMSEVAEVTGTPQIAITVGSTTRYALYTTGDGTTTLRFSYTTQVGDDDADGIVMSNTVALPGGATIKNGSNVDFALGFTPPNTSLIKVDTSVPTITSVDGPANDTYGVGETMRFIVHTSEAVDVVSGGGGPRLQLTIGAATQYAVYNAGASTSDDLAFDYVVQTGDIDTDGIQVNTTLQLQTGTIEDSFDNALSPLTFIAPTLTGVLVDAVAPTITSVTAPSPGSYKAGANLDFIVNFSESVDNGAGLQPRLQITVGATTRYAMYQGGTNSNQWTFRYTVQAGETDTDGIALSTTLQLNGATIQDDNLNDLSPLTFSAVDTSAVRVDTTAPSIVSVVNTSGPSTYTSGQSITFTVTFSEAVYVNNTPALDLTVGSTARTAGYTGGSASTTWTFVHNVVNGDYDNNGIAMATSINLYGGSIADAAGNASGLTFTPPTLTTTYVDAVLPIISSITVPGNAAYKNGTAMTFTLNLNKIVNVTVANPRIVLNVGGATKYATYSGGTGTQSLTFSYDPLATDLDMDGIDVTGASLDLNGATMRDALNNNLNLTYPSIASLAQVFVVYPAFQNWYDLDNSATVSFTNDGTGDAINTLTDIMGVSNLTQTGTARPYYFASGFGTANRGYMKFDGTNDGLLFGTDPNVKQVIIVYRSQGSLATNVPFAQYSGGNPTRRRIEPATSNTLNFNVTADYSVNGGAFSASNTSHTWAWAANTNYVQTVRWATMQGGRSAMLGSNNGSNYFNGRIAAVIILDDTSVALTGSEYTALHNFLMTKYGVP